MKNIWKVLAIVFLVIAVLEAVFIIWVYSWGTNAIEQETECSFNVCSNDVSYYYDDWSELCYCYNEDGYKTKSRFLG